MIFVVLLTLHPEKKEDEDEEKRILKYMYKQMTSELHEYTLVCTNTLFEWNMELS